jgi:hypothetical protein
MPEIGERGHCPKLADEKELGIDSAERMRIVMFMNCLFFKHFLSRTGHLTNHRVTENTEKNTEKKNGEESSGK